MGLWVYVLVSELGVFLALGATELNVGPLLGFLFCIRVDNASATYTRIHVGLIIRGGLFFHVYKVLSNACTIVARIADVPIINIRSLAVTFKRVAVTLFIGV